MEVEVPVVVLRVVPPVVPVVVVGHATVSPAVLTHRRVVPVVVAVAPSNCRLLETSLGLV
jgi:hypothetical protein